MSLLNVFFNVCLKVGYKITTCVCYVCFVTGAETPRERSPFINSIDPDRLSYYDGKNMALFEVSCPIVIK